MKYKLNKKIKEDIRAAVVIQIDDLRKNINKFNEKDNNFE